MNIQKPFIYKFKTKSNYYIYDVNTNNILLVDQKVFNTIDTENWMKNKNIMNSRKIGLLLSERPKRILEKICFDDLKEKLDRNIQMITLFITSRCNLNCGYCYFSDSYENKMKLKNRIMDIKTATKAIDFYFLRSNGNSNDKFPIGFYGGEPFLNFDLLKETVNYVKNNYSEKFIDTIFTVTTNFTILNNEIMEFLIENNIHIAVSLDGPKDLHDRYRVFKNGSGSHDIVMSNLKRIYDFNKDYFYQHIVYNVVLSLPIDFIETYKFFQKKLFFKSNFSKIGMLLINGSHLFEKKFKIKTDCGIDTLTKLYKIYEKKIKNSDIIENRFLSRVFDENFMEIHNREIFKLESEIREKGSCVPGMFRPMVDEDGNLYPCEKGGFFNLGNINNGFDYNKCYKLVYDFAKLRNEICLNCWAIRFCGKCYIGAEKHGKIDKDTKLEQCERIKRYYSLYLKRYVEMLWFFYYI